jgi:hypothetical protein
MGYLRTHERLHLCCLNPRQHSNTCGYWYIITQGGGSPHCAFRTKAGLMQWAAKRGLYFPCVIPNPGTYLSCPIGGSYREEVHLHDAETFDALKVQIDTRTLSNGDYVEAKITFDPDGIRTVHTLNPNVESRHEFDYRESEALIA